MSPFREIPRILIAFCFVLGCGLSEDVRFPVFTVVGYSVFEPGDGYALTNGRTLILGCAIDRRDFQINGVVVEFARHLCSEPAPQRSAVDRWITQPAPEGGTAEGFPLYHHTLSETEAQLLLENRCLTYRCRAEYGPNEWVLDSPLCLADPEETRVCFPEGFTGVINP